MTEEELTYEQAREQLLEIVTRLETGGTTLDESLALWEQGERLADIAQKLLAGASAKLTPTES